MARKTKHSSHTNLRRDDSRERQWVDAHAALDASRAQHDIASMGQRIIDAWQHASADHEAIATRVVIAELYIDAYDAETGPFDPMLDSHDTMETPPTEGTP